jgi:hypothetical protein
MNNNSTNKDITPLSTKMVIINNTIENDLVYMSNMLNIMNLDVLYIFYIVADDSIEYEIFEHEHYSKIKYIEIGLRFFMKNF